MLQAGCELTTASNKPQNWRAISISWCPVFLLVLPRLRIVVSSSSSSSRLAINFLAPVAGRVESPSLPPPSSLVASEVHGLALCLIWRSKCSTSGRPALVQLVLWPKIWSQSWHLMWPANAERQIERERGVVVLSQATLQIARMHQVLPKCGHLDPLWRLACCTSKYSTILMCSKFCWLY